jgi:putative solute:sodium symporter small subunit
MADTDQTAWWVRTAALATIVLASLAAIVCVPLLLAGWFDRATLFGLPFGYFLLALAAPVVLALGIFWFADRQRVLDHAYHVIED